MLYLIGAVLGIGLFIVVFGIGLALGTKHTPTYKRKGPSNVQIRRRNGKFG